MQRTVLSGPPDSQKAFCDGRVSTRFHNLYLSSPGVGRSLCLSYHTPGGDGLGRVALQVDGGIAACARGVGGGVGPLLDAAEHLIAQALHGLHLGRGAPCDRISVAREYDVVGKGVVGGPGGRRRDKAVVRVGVCQGSE